MTSLIPIQERAELVKASSFPHATFPFKNFNPVQSGIFDVYDKDANCIVAASTSAGKTVCFEMMASHEIRVRKNKVIYLSPLKSLSQEKFDSWLTESHHFADLKVAICTGDYRVTASRIKELEAADIIIMTSEMLNSMSRNFKSDKNRFLQDVKLVGIDESHLLGVPGRGDHLESGMMKFTEANPEARLLLLSATMPNVDEVGRWLHFLNKRSTYLLRSNYRPCILNIHYEEYWDKKFDYKGNEWKKIYLAKQLICKYPKDKFICFVHSKRTGKDLFEDLARSGIWCDYHNANLSKDKRIEIERQFREDPKLRVIIATSGLAQGLNLPARRVIILGVHRGLSEVDTHEIIQECGRAGRPQYDKEGDAHILLPRTKFNEHKERLSKPVYIQSQMVNPKVLAFHLISEIHHGTIKNMEDVHRWYARTLASFQKKPLDEEVADRVIQNLIFSGCLRDSDEGYSVTTTGRVSSMFYYSPFDVADLNRNFSLLFENEMADDDYWLSMALGNLDSNRITIVNSAEREEMEEFFGRVSGSKIEKTLSPKQPFTQGAMKAGYCHYMLLHGKSSNNLNNYMRGHQMDFGRTAEVLTALDTMNDKWGEGKFFKSLGLRIAYGIPEELVSLCNLSGIGKVKATKLWNAGMRELKSINDVTKVIKALGCSKTTAEEIVSQALSLKDAEQLS